MNLFVFFSFFFFLYLTFFLKSKFMESDLKLIFKEKFQPTPFSFIIRDGNRSGEGVLSIEESFENGASEPIRTVVNNIQTQNRLRFALNASTNVSFTPKKYHVHAWTSHKFSDSTKTELSL